eukprot:CAMPEP_0176014626 /NCGR_PEP_ID=MMETSP0120_2-20121206/6920_1 /TAXON_ID=160619 /ORGANISM="Kryptoperidinium foliaceum, Strain CCMP 1326" /LENGTH=410 /DNA_ID=CAMNT_0017347573 /DNA_START=81 /DNA_END=1313 /DNA_ORIENTATION=-
MSKKYDIVLFGVTGFTGKLAAEYLLQRGAGISWAVSARSLEKAKAVFASQSSTPDILVADLLCKTDEDRGKLRSIVEQTKVVLTCSGPFEKYGQDLVALCAELGVHYADITGETDYFRQTIQKHDQQAQTSGAAILCHCGHDCIPVDLMVYELNNFASNQGCELKKVLTYQEFWEDFGPSGGTAATAAFQLSKDRANTEKPAFDPLLTTKTGEKSEFHTKNACPKSDIDVPALPGRKAGPWIMAPVMMNCVRRSNALLGYSKEFSYGDSAVKVQSWSAWAKGMATNLAMGAKIYAPGVLGGLVDPFIPQTGEGPSREGMENGFLKLHATATMVDRADASKTRELSGLFEFRKDTGYLYTAALLCETGLLLAEKHGSLEGGCATPAAALGGDLTERILKNLESSLEIKETT